MTAELCAHGGQELVLVGLFGPGFTDGVPLLAVLGVGMAVRAAAGPVQSVLLLGGLSRAQLMNKVIALAVCLVGNLALTARWGVRRAAPSPSCQCAGRLRIAWAG